MYDGSTVHLERKKSIIDKWLSEHQTNCPKQNTSGFTGVYYCKHFKRWKAIIEINRKRFFLGSYKDKEIAMAARKLAEKLKR